MVKAQKTYRKKCKRRYIDFYIKDQDLYEFSKTLNFQDFVKICLKCEMIEEEMHRLGDFAISLNEEDYLER